MMFEYIAIAIVTAYVALVVLGHVLLISAIYKCARGDRPKGKFGQTTAGWAARLRFSVRRISRAENMPVKLYRCAAICGVAAAALAIATIGQRNPIYPYRVSKDAILVSEASNLAPGLPEDPPYNSVERLRSAEFFLGSVEFDWDPNAPGGVPGFGPSSKPARPLARITTQQ